METQRERIHRKNKALLYTALVIGMRDACNMFATSFFSLFAGTIAEHVGDGGCWNPLGVWVATVPAKCSLRTYNVNSRTRTVVSLLPHFAPGATGKQKLQSKRTTWTWVRFTRTVNSPGRISAGCAFQTAPCRTSGRPTVLWGHAEPAPAQVNRLLYCTKLIRYFSPGDSPSSSGFSQLFSNFHQFSPGFHQVFKDPCVLFPLGSWRSVLTPRWWSGTTATRGSWRSCASRARCGRCSGTRPGGVDWEGGSSASIDIITRSITYGIVGWLDQT